MNMNFAVIDRDHPLRSSVEQMVRDLFFKEYGARPATFPALMAAMFDDEGRPVAATGLRFSSDGFFSQCYLDRPVEAEISRLAGRPVAASEVVEVSSLVGLRAGAGMALVHAAIAYAYGCGARWGMFTATRRLMVALRRSGFEAVEMAKASRDRVSNPDDWGTYYLQEPVVLAVRAEGVPVLAIPGVTQDVAALHA